MQWSFMRVTVGQLHVAVTNHTLQRTLPPVYELLSSTHQLDQDVKIPAIGLKWLTVTLLMYVERFICKFHEHCR